MGEPFCFAGAREKIDQFIPDFYQYQPVVRKIAEDFDAAFIPYQGIYDKAMKGAPDRYYSSDGVHPALPGIHLMARAWMDQVEVRAYGSAIFPRFLFWIPLSVSANSNIETDRMSVV